MLLVDGQEGIGIPGNDPGLVRGLNVFESMRTYGRAPFRLEQHLDRLEASATAIEVPFPSRDVLRAEVDRVIDADDRWVRVLLTAGGHRVVESGPVDASKVGRAVRVARVDWEPSPWLPGSIKHTSRAGWQRAAVEMGVDEVLFVDRSGGLLEANQSNVFAVIGGALRTPAADGRILSGVTRSAMLEAAAEAGVPVEVGFVPAAGPFDELYVSSTYKQLAPCRLDGGPPLAGPIGARVFAAFQVLVARETA